MYFSDEEEISAVRRVFAKKLYRYNSNHDSECDLFENEFSAHIGIAHSILLSSGTNALITSLFALGLKPEDEVIIPAYTFVATATAVVQAGCRPVIVNIDPQFGIDIDDLKKKITQRTKAVIIVHMDGLASNVGPVLDLCRERNLILIEDVAQALGGSFQNKRLGTWGSAGCFSLNENKVLSCGEGGIISLNDRIAYEKSFCFHDSASQFNPHKKNIYQNITPFIGASMRVSEIQGALMRVQLGRLELILSELRLRKNIFREIIGSKVLTGHCLPGDCATSIHLQFDTIDETLIHLKKLTSSGLPFSLVTSRPAHAAWKWMDLLNRHFEKENSNHIAYTASDLISSIDILTRTIKLDVDLGWAPTECKEKAAFIKNMIQ